MFYGGFLLENLDELKNWNILNVLKIEGMFERCVSLKNLN